MLGAQTKPRFLSFHVTTYFLYAHAVCIHSKYLKKGSFAFAHKDVRCTNKTEINDGLQYTN